MELKVGRSDVGMCSGNRQLAGVNMSGKRTNELYQNVTGDDRPQATQVELLMEYISQFRPDADSIPDTPAYEVLKKANLLLQAKVVDSSPATSSCHIPVGAAGVKLFMSANSGAGAIEQRPRQGNGGPAGGATKVDVAAENEPGAETCGSVFKCQTNAPQPEPTLPLRTKHSFTRAMPQVSDSIVSPAGSSSSAHKGNLMHSHSWNTNQATPQNVSRSPRNFMSTIPYPPPPEEGGVASWAEVLTSCASGSEKKGEKEGVQQDLDLQLVAALAAEACLPARHAGCDSRCVRFFF